VTIGTRVWIVNVPGRDQWPLLRIGRVTYKYEDTGHVAVKCDAGGGAILSREYLLPVKEDGEQ
jgi:hypothetical protein